jgi:DeoR/GlpR family transcriptional regulator of sugar metabolism
MIRSANKSILLGDSAKYRRHGVFEVCQWADIDILITDSGLPETARTAVREAGTAVKVAKAREKIE